GVFDDGVYGLQQAVLLRARNHRLRHPVLDADRRVLPLELREDARTLGRDDLLKADHRCVSDRAENVHGLSSHRQWFSRWAESTVHETPCHECVSSEGIEKLATTGL